MASWRRQYLYTCRYPTTGIYRLTGLWPQFSESESYIRLSDDEGGAVEYISETGSSVLNPMVDVNLSFPFSAEPGDRVVTLDAVLPDDASSEAAWVRFGLEIDRLRVWDGIHTYRPGCYETPPPALFGPESFDVLDRWSAAFSAKVINLLYDNDETVIDVIQQWAGDEATVTWIPEDETPGHGVAACKVGRQCFIWVIGTTTNSQLIQQTADLNAGSKGYVNYSTAPIWRNGMSGAIDILGTYDISTIDTITVAGHSMGGAIACNLVAMLDLAHPAKTVNILTFGCPRAGDYRMREILARKRTNHIVTVLDPVPTMPPHPGEIGVPLPLAYAALSYVWLTYSVLGRYTVLSSDGRLTPGMPPPTTNIALTGMLAALAAGGIVAGGEAHSMVTYERLLRLVDS